MATVRSGMPVSFAIRAIFWGIAVGCRQIVGSFIRRQRSLDPCVDCRPLPASLPTCPAVLDSRLQDRLLTTERIRFHAAQVPVAATFVARKTREFVLAAFGHDRDIDRCVKSGRGRHGALPGEFEQTERAQEIENVGAFRPRNLTILRSAKCFEYNFVGIRGHLVVSSCAAMTTLVTVARRSATSTKRGAPNSDCDERLAAECLATACVRCCFLLQAPVDSALITRSAATSADAFRSTR